MAQCLTCTSAKNCTSCNTGFFANITCINCTSKITNCTACKFNTTLTCSSCNIGFTPNVNGTACVKAPCNVSNCNLCGATILVCANCTNGYYANASASQCISRCGDGIKVDSEDCDDGNNIDGDGCNADCTIGNKNGCPAVIPIRDPVTNSCTSICPDGYFPNTAVYGCTICSIFCLTCLDLNTCLSCDQKNNR
jgi:proprotein convertase subtilisin/kexin type 5